MQSPNGIDTIKKIRHIVKVRSVKLGMTEIEPEPGSDLIQTLQPIAALSALRIEELRPLCHIECVPAGMTLFREGETDRQSIYLLFGEMVLSSAADELSYVLSAAGGDDGTQRQLRPIADKQPRRLSAMAVTQLDIMRVDSELLDIMVTWDTLASCLATAGPNSRHVHSGVGDDWMGIVRQCLAFRHIPPANFASLGMKLGAVAVRAGQVVAREGDQASDYYLIDSGTAIMTCETDGIGPADTIVLGPGSGFGTESLAVDDCHWQATVTMETRGTLLRLARRDFLALRREPPLSRLSLLEAQSKTESGAILLDVRGLEEAPDSLLPGVHHLPLDTLCQVVDGLERNLEYICCCNTGRRSTAAAHLLGQRGLRAHVLAGGMRSVPEGLASALC